MRLLPTRTATLLPWLLAAVLLAHWPTLLAPFQFDDIHQLGNNGQLRDPGNLGRVFSDPRLGFADGKSSSYRPLLYASFILEHQLADGATWPYRVVSLLSLCGLALLAARFASRLLGRLFPDATAPRLAGAGSLAALLVAVHPLFNQALLLASARASLWLALFGLLALIPLLEPRRTAWREAAVLLPATLLALLSKESGVILAPLALLLCLLFGSGSLPARVWRAWPILLPVAAYVVFHREVVAGIWAAAEALPFPKALGKQVDAHLYPAQGGWALLGLLRLALFPWGLSPVHDLPTPSGLGAVLGYAVWPAVLLLAALGWRRGGQWRLAGFALGWYALAMALPLFLVVLNTPFAEHRTVLAVLPLLAALGWWLGALPPRAAGLVTPGLLLLLAAAAALQSWPWRSPTTLWEWQVGVEPQSPRAWGFLAAARLEAGDLDGAARAIDRALTRSPDHPLLLGQAASIALARQDRAAARRYVERGLRGGGDIAVLHALMAMIQSFERDFAGARTHAERAVALSPRIPGNWVALGNVRFLSGDRDAAVAAYREALALDPGHAQAAANLRRALGAGRDAGH